jgi:ferredoxin-NADP reductase
VSWQGTRRFRIASKTAEGAGAVSLVLAPVDGQPLAPFRPGQFLTLELRVPGAARPLVRCYSISSAPNGREYRITIKASGASGASSFLVEGTRVSDELLVRAPAGSFTLDPGSSDPVVLVAGGIGVTPFASMLAAGPRRPVHLVLGMRNRGEFPLRDELERLARATPDTRLHVVYSQPGPGEGPRGRVSVELLKDLLPPAERPYDFYLCGPPAMLHDLTEGLGALGIPASKLHVELFDATAAREVARATGRLGRGAALEVTFARSGKKAVWDPKQGALLYLAEKAGVGIPYACAAGSCGTCATRLVSGEVVYPSAPGFRLRAGMCLPCVAVPLTSVVLDV